MTNNDALDAGTDLNDLMAGEWTSEAADNRPAKVEMSERERLIKWAKQLADPNWCLSVPKEAKDAISALLKELESRTVTTVEELDALPVGSVVLRNGRAFQRYEPRETLGFRFDKWMCADGGVVIAEHDGSAIVPATVLHEGNES